MIFASKIDFANFPPTSLVWYATHKAETLFNCLNYFCVLRNRPKRPWPSVGRLLPAEFWKLARFGESLCHKYKCPSFQIRIIRKLSTSSLYKSDNNSSHQIFTEYHIPQNTRSYVSPTSDCVSRWQVLTIFKIELSKLEKVNLEEVHRKWKFKVSSTNICNKTCWHRFPSVWDELLKFTDFAIFSVDSPLHRILDSAMIYIQIALIIW